MIHIFISYAKLDGRAQAEALHQRLNAEQDIIAWMDLSLEPGDSWAAEISEEIDKADFVVVLLTPDVNRKPSAAKGRSFVINEINYAGQAGKIIIPLMVIATKIPVQIADLQYIDFTTHPREGTERLLRRIRRGGDATDTQPPKTFNERNIPSAVSKPSARIPLVLAIVVLMLVLGSFLALPALMGGGSPTQTPTYTPTLESTIATPVHTHTATGTDSPTETATSTATHTLTHTATATNTSTETPAATVTPTATHPTDTPTATFTPSITPTATLDTSVHITAELLAPGQSPNGIAWDGETLWLADNSTTIFNMDTSGRILASYSAPNATPEGLVWDGESFWLFTTNLGNIYEFAIADGKLVTLSQFKSPNSRISGDLNDGLAWDGEYLWYADTYNVYQLTQRGEIVNQLAFPKEVGALTWDGTSLWIAYSTFLEPSTLVRVDPSGAIQQTYSTPLEKIYGMVWTDEGLWVIGKKDGINTQEGIFRLSVPYTPSPASSPTATAEATNAANDETDSGPAALFTVRTNANVNLRSGPSTQNTALGIIPINTLLDIYQTTGAGAWYKVNYKGVEGWVSAAAVAQVAMP